MVALQQAAYWLLPVGGGDGPVSASVKSVVNQSATMLLFCGVAFEFSALLWPNSNQRPPPVGARRLQKLTRSRQALILTAALLAAAHLSASSRLSDMVEAALPTVGQRERLHAVMGGASTAAVLATWLYSRKWIPPAAGSNPTMAVLAGLSMICATPMLYLYLRHGHACVEDKERNRLLPPGTVHTCCASVMICYAMFVLQEMKWITALVRIVPK